MKDLHQDYWARGVEFLLIELDLGLTFSSIALSRKDEGQRIRNMRNARASYDAVMRFLPLVRLTKAEALSIEQKSALLQQRLARISALLDDDGAPQSQSSI